LKLDDVEEEFVQTKVI